VKEKIKVGDIVAWVCKPNGLKAFNTKGEVVSLGVSILGSSKESKVARILVKDRKYKRVFPNRKHTTVGIDKLTKITDHA
jgi:hypothetical protein